MPMQLTPPQLQDLLSTLDAVCKPDVEKDLRQDPRIRRQAALSIELDEDGGESHILIALKDISPAGIGFAFWQPINPGRRFWIELPRSDGHLITVVCKVMNCRQTDDGAYRIGATFLRTIAKPRPRPRAQVA
jgi:hypothetical protein